MVNPWPGLKFPIEDLLVFVSTYESAIDVKGRVSIPASFRQALGGGNRIFLWPALNKSGCLEGGGDALMQMYRETITRLPPQSRERQALQNALFARASDLKMDETGRIKLPKNLIEAAGLSDRAKFAGNVDSFQIWSPERHNKYEAEMVEIAAGDHALAALGQAYDDVLRAQPRGGVNLKIVDGANGGLE